MDVPLSYTFATDSSSSTFRKCRGGENRNHYEHLSELHDVISCWFSMAVVVGVFL
jgi:hypothetical protein